MLVSAPLRGCGAYQHYSAVLKGHYLAVLNRNNVVAQTIEYSFAFFAELTNTTMTRLDTSLVLFTRLSD